MKAQTTLLLGFFAGPICVAQTYVSGGMYADEVWTVANSPYVVTDTITVFPGSTLTIEPGVLVKVDDDRILEVRGSLIALGTINDTIRFTSSSTSPYMGCWGGVYINTWVGASAFLDHCRMDFAASALSVECCWNGGPVEIRHSTFVNNRVALGGYAGWDEIVDSCRFANNEAAVTQADKVIAHSVFVNNVYGLYRTERISVRTSHFCNNDVALYGGRDVLEENTIVNNRIGIRSFFDGFYDPSNNTIMLNDTGIVLNPYEVSGGIGTGNIICQNSSCNVLNLMNLNIDATGNCWCNTDSAVIAGTILDGYDDIDFGLIDPIPSLSCPAVIMPYVECDDVFSGYEQAVEMRNGRMWISPNPFTSQATIGFEEVHGNTTIMIRDLLGNEVWQCVVTGRQFTLDRGGLSNGVYLLHATDAVGNVMSGKVIVQ